VRLVTNDNLTAAKACAVQLGLISPSEMNQQYVCMEGEELKELSGGITIEQDSKGGHMKKTVNRKYAFMMACEKMRVLARCSPEV
jgi:magnesium-transporting ATPase (P-type)